MAKPRDKRFSGIFTGIATIVAILSGAFSVSANYQIAQLSQAMDNMAARFDTLREGLEMGIGATQNITAMTAEGF